MTTYTTIANIKGPQGIQGPQGVGLPGVNAVANDTATAGYLATPGSNSRGALDAILRENLPLTPEQYGAVGDGVADDTVAVRACFDAANAAARTGVIATIQHPGAAVQLTGSYNLATLAAPIDVKCNVLQSQAEFRVPAAYAGVAVRVGHLTAGSYFQSAAVSLPDIVKQPLGAAIIPGCVGVRVQNLGNSKLTFGRIMYFDTAQHYTGAGQGAVYLDVFPGYISYCKTPFKIKPDMAGGWANQINFYGGGVQQSPGYAGGVRRPGWKHVEINGNGINNVDQIHFFGTSFEGDVSENWLEIANARDITFTGCRHEQGTQGVPVTFYASNPTVDWNQHTLVVGDMVAFTATTSPGGLLTSSPYYVASVVHSSAITVSQKKGGVAVTPTSTGTSVLGWRPPRARFDSSVNLSNIQIENPYTILGVMEVVDTLGLGGNGNSVQTPSQRTVDAYGSDDLPLYRARNWASAAVSRPLFAAYPPAVRPWENPRGWSTALSDRGVLFASAEAETARLFNSSGVLSWQRAGQAVAQIATSTRSPALLAVTALSCPGSATTTTTFALTGAATNDHLLVTVVGTLPAGIIYSHAWVSAAGTITVAFANVTAAAISVTQSLQAISFARYF